MVIAASTDSTAKEGTLPVCLKRAALVKAGEFIKVRVDDEEEWFLNPLLNLHLPELGGKDFTQQVQMPESFVSWLRAQLGNRVRALRSDGFVGLFSSQQMVIQGRFKDSRLRQALARNPAITAKLDGALERQMPPGETTDEGIENLGMVLPCDDSQLRIVQRANFGSSLIVEGPPGTGKTQTIANIIGNALWRGENVLFVCEKRTAVSQVARTRDRAREAVLRQRGWRIHRVWSTNWWNFEEQEKQAIRDQIAAARAALKIEPKEREIRESQSSGGFRFVPRNEVPGDPDVGQNPHSDGDNYFKLS